MILYLSITALILSVLIAYNNHKKNKNSFLLTSYLFVLCIYSLLHYFLFEGNSVFSIAVLFRHFSPLFYIPGALLFLYVKGVLKKEWNFSKHDLWHFTPAIIGFINIAPYYFIPFEEKYRIAEKIFAYSNFSDVRNTALIYPFYISAIIRSVLFSAYVLACISLLYNCWKNHADKKKEENRTTQFNWLLFLVSNAVLLAICFNFLTIDVYTNEIVKKEYINNYLFTVIAGLTFSLIPTVIIFFPKVLYGITKYECESVNGEKAKNTLSDKNLYLLGARIVEYFENDKPYLNKSFSLDNLANHLDVPKHHLYACLKTCLIKKFTQLRTSYRIEYAKKLLLQSDLDSKTLQGVWMESGFSSKTNFFTTFKEETGLTPTEYILLENNIQ
jgi:AraC-like DNA-binding protein